MQLLGRLTGDPRLKQFSVFGSNFDGRFHRQYASLRKAKGVAGVSDPSHIWYGDFLSAFAVQAVRLSASQAQCIASAHNQPVSGSCT